MGGDGGTSSHARRDQLRMFTPGAVPATQADPAASPATAASVALSTCALSREPLEPPVVVCSRGYLYNKAAVLVHLLSLKRSRTGAAASPAAATTSQPGGDAAFSHLRRRADVMDVTLMMLSDCRRQQQAPGGGGGGREGVVTPAFACPITRREASGLERWLAVVPCGCVVSGAGWEGVAGDVAGGAGGVDGRREGGGEHCPVCEGPVDGRIVLGGGKGAGGRLRERPAKGSTAKASSGRKRERGGCSDGGTRVNGKGALVAAVRASDGAGKNAEAGVPERMPAGEAREDGSSHGPASDGKTEKRRRQG
ncbi:hypothetical protein MMPV_001039 [Pyropia vietnamensis]